MSTETTGSSPTTQPSWPGGMTYASPGPYSFSVPSSILIRSRPDTWYPVCSTWQLSVPAMGLTFSDHLQPGSNTSREAVKSPRVTTSALPFSNVLLSSGWLGSCAGYCLRPCLLTSPFHCYPLANDSCEVLGVL